MKGIVKWFSSEKGFGFVVGDDDIERYVNIQNVKGVHLPKNGDVVEFEHSDGQKGPRCLNLSIVSSEKTDKIDDRVICLECNRKMVPRIVFYKGHPNYSLCPFCGNRFKKFETTGLCFIATAVYQQNDAEPVLVLRRFRDDILSKSVVGRGFIFLYYNLSPNIAEILVRHDHLQKWVRIALDCLVKLIKRFRN